MSNHLPTPFCQRSLRTTPNPNKLFLHTFNNCKLTAHPQQSNKLFHHTFEQLSISSQKMINSWNEHFLRTHDTRGQKYVTYFVPFFIGNHYKCQTKTTFYEIFWTILGKTTAYGFISNGELGFSKTTSRYVNVKKSNRL